MKVRVQGATVTQETAGFSPRAQELRITLACGHVVIEEVPTNNRTRIPNWKRLKSATELTISRP